ncbi:MAG: type II secretion system protein [Planctomycetota bacterium]|jgi:prepilin-type N-terminal cleavage/methylation domain-containing protein/prepilin-type processing-associated H-X9-DG protein
MVDMRRSGFTLIELLVVIAVIAALVAMILPVSRAVKQRAKAVMCESNLKQLSLALTMYGQDNKTLPNGFDDLSHGQVEPHGGYPGNPSRDKQGWWWFHFLADTLGENFEEGTVFWCPSRNIEEPFVLCGNYGVNRAICKDAQPQNGEFAGTPLGLGQIRQAARTLLMIDSGYSLISWRGVTNNTNTGPFENPMRTGAFYVPGLTVNKERTISPGFESDALNGRHPNRTVNVVFADGHSARAKADDLFVEKIGDNYTNRSPLWLPE